MTAPANDPYADLRAARDEALAKITGNSPADRYQRGSIQNMFAEATGEPITNADGSGLSIEYGIWHETLGLHRRGMSKRQADEWIESYPDALAADHGFRTASRKVLRMAWKPDGD